MKRSGESSSAGTKPDRKTIEKNRRIVMKGLCFKLVSLIPDHHFTQSKEYLSQNDQLGQSAAYIKKLKERVDELKRRKTENTTNRDHESKMPILKIKDIGSNIVEVVLVTGVNKNFKLHQIISILEEEGAEVVAVSISTIGDNIFHTLHAQVKVPRVGMDTSRLSERINDLIAQIEALYTPINSLSY